MFKTVKNVKRSIKRHAAYPGMLDENMLMSDVIKDEAKGYEVILGLEDDFKICLKNEDFYAATTVGAVVALVMNSAVVKPKRDFFGFRGKSLIEPLSKIFSLCAVKEELDPDRENIKKVIKKLAEYEDELDDDDLMSDVAEDSMQSYEILLGLEEAFDVCLKDSDYFAAKTVGDVVRLIQRLK